MFKLKFKFFVDFFSFLVYLELNNGKMMPILGFSTWLTNRTDAYQLTKTAIEKGYRFIDTLHGFMGMKRKLAKQSII